MWLVCSRCYLFFPLLQLKFPFLGKLAKPRQLHNSQWGMMCPAETPEGQVSMCFFFFFLIKLTTFLFIFGNLILLVRCHSNLFSFDKSGMWTGEESCIDGVHNCRISCISYIGIFGRMGDRKFWGVFLFFFWWMIYLFASPVWQFSFHLGFRKFPLLLFPKLPKFLLMVVGLVYIVILTCWWKHYDVWGDGSVWFFLLFWFQ